MLSKRRFETDAVLSQFVNVGRSYYGIAVAAHTISAQLIRKYQNDVRHKNISRQLSNGAGSILPALDHNIAYMVGKPHVGLKRRAGLRPTYQTGSGQRDMAQLFQMAVNTVNEHIARIYDEEESQRSSTIRTFRKVQKVGKRSVTRDVAHCNLDMIISVGYRVNSYRGTQFRIWATRTLTTFIKKGFVKDDDRLVHRNQGYMPNIALRPVDHALHIPSL